VIGPQPIFIHHTALIMQVDSYPEIGRDVGQACCMGYVFDCNTVSVRQQQRNLNNDCIIVVYNPLVPCLS
jgi:hypothetical protein